MRPRAEGAPKASSEPSVLKTGSGKSPLREPARQGRACDKLGAVKRLVDLTMDDLVAHPVWRYEGGVGRDAIVVHATKATLSRSDDEIFLAGTDFELFDTTKHFGFCFPADDTGIAYLQPVIVTRSGPVSFWFDESPSDEKLSKQWRLLGKNEAEIFPATLRCRVLVDGRIVTGRITGVESADPSPKGVSEEPRRVGIGTGEKRTSRRRQA